MMEVVLAWMLMGSLALTLITLVHGRRIMKPRTFLLLFITTLAVLGSVVMLAVREASGRQLPDPTGDVPFQVHVFSVAGADGGVNCVAIREETKVMGGATVALALSCHRRLPRPEAF